MINLVSHSFSCVKSIGKKTEREVVFPDQIVRFVEELKHEKTNVPCLKSRNIQKHVKSYNFMLINNMLIRLQ